MTPSDFKTMMFDMNRSTRTTLLTLLALSLVVLVASGCDSLLDLDPKQSIPAERALETPSNVEAALNGAYNVISNENLYGGQLMMLPDLLADAGEVNWTGTYEEPREIWVKEILVNNFYVEEQWADPYQTINIANNVLSALDVFEDAAQRERVEGEARFIRGLLYFELVRLFARPWNDGNPASNLGVPVVLEPTTEIGEAQNVVRNSVADVYAQAIDDLTAAVDLLPESNDVKPTTYMASAVLARVYLQQGRYELAAQAASRVIESGMYELAATYEGAFNNVENIAEYIFAIDVTPQDGDNDLNVFYASEENNGRGDIDITEEHLGLYEEGDVRGDFFYTDGEGKVRTSKWMTSTAEGTNVPVIRLAEMYLIRAEANLRAGTSVGPNTPVEDVNVLRERAGLEPLDAVTVADVLHERKVELAFEGLALHDVKRTESSVNQLPFNAPELIYPVPQREMDANPSMEQNAGYLN